MAWQRITIDELSAFNKAVGEKILNCNGIWWQETRACFFRPLNVMEEINPNKISYPKRSLLGGIQHRTKQGDFSNSFLNYFIFSELENYSIDNFRSKKKWEVKKGVKNFIIKPVSDFEEFIEQGYEVYLSFYKRTKYNYKKGRTQKKYFVNWAKILFDYPKILILGAYQKDQLSAVSVSYLLEEHINYSTFFSKSEALSNNVSDAMLHYMRETAKECSGVQAIFWGMLTGNRNIDYHKVCQGCKIVSFPSFYRVNPFILYYMKFFNKKNYLKLLGSTIDQKSEN
jgi:hypothetical protein